MCGVWLKGDSVNRVYLLMFVCYVFRLVGAIFIGYLDNKSSKTDDTIWGDCLALISGFIYAIYVTLIKYRIGD